MALRKPLVITAVLLVFLKALQFAVDSQVLFYDDSGAFLLNALGYAFIPERSYVYSALIGTFCVSMHSLRPIVVMQVVMSGLSAWLLAFILLRYLSVRPWIAIAAALAFAFDPVQIVHERLILTETMALLAGVLYLWAALEYMQKGSWIWLVPLSLAGILLVSLRIVYVPVVLAGALLLPLGAYLKFGRQVGVLAVALLISCGSTLVLQIGYQQLTGKLAGRAPAYHYRTGDFLVTLVAPLIKPEDAWDARIAEAVREQDRSSLPLFDPEFRTQQMWEADGLVARLRSVFHGDEREANLAADRLARAAMWRDPLGIVRLGFHTYAEYWRELPELKSILAKENGSPPRPVVPQDGARMILAEFGADVYNQHTLQTPSRRYHLKGRYWNVLLLASPLVAFVAVWGSPRVIVIALWALLLIIATCFGAAEAGYRYLHPFSFPALASAAVLAESLFPRRAS